MPAADSSGAPAFDLNVLDIDCESAVERIRDCLVEQVRGQLRRRGTVLGLSGGVDSSVTAALCVRAFGPKNVLGLFMPEADSSDESLELGHIIADHLGVETETEDITPVLEGAGCYARRNEAIRALFPDFGPGWKCKIVLPPDRLDSDRLNVFSLVVQSPEGEVSQARLPLKQYLQVVAASNMKQRTRKMLEYYHAERTNFAVAGTPNRLEYDQGFFVKGGDGLADVKPIAHLYKTQVYALARHLGLPEAITSRPPTTDTYSMPQTQEEFFFCLPYDKLDLILWAYNHHVAAGIVGEVMGYTIEQVQRVYRDVEAKRRTTAYLHMAPLLVEPIEGVGK